VEFPPSSTILIPSALITHYNTPVKDNETRFSIVQYVQGAYLGGLRMGSRQIRHGMKMLPAEMKEQRERDDAERWEKFLDMFTKYEELIV
jgi:hypothetical protein